MKVEIRPLKESDAYTSVRWRNIPELWTYTNFSSTREITIQDELNWIRKVLRKPEEARFAILADGEYIGNIYLTGIHNGIGEYHIFIGEREYWGKGIARKASELIIEYGKGVLMLRTITLSVKKDNSAAHHLYTSLGFREVGEEGGFTLMELGTTNSDSI